ncbi:MAG: pentapeptide repeat-containing protein [Hyphomonadaceae bacterium]
MKRALIAFALMFAAATPALAQNAGQIARVEAGANCASCDLLQIDLSFQNAIGRNYSGSRLIQAGMTAGVYDRTNFTGADMAWIDAAAARFTGARFENARLENANFVGAYLGGANFTAANLRGANLSGAELETARGLTQSQLNSACGDANTRLPQGMTIPAC